MQVKTEDLYSSLVDFVNEHPDLDMDIDRYQKIPFYINDSEAMQKVIDTCKFKDIGSIYEYQDELPQPDIHDGYSVSLNFNKYQRILVSKKFNSVALYTYGDFVFYCVFLMDVKKIKKFFKICKGILEQDVSDDNMFQNVDFKCKPGTYVEITRTIDHKRMKPINTSKKTVSNENLVFDKDSSLSDIINDISTFFKKDTQELYKKMQIAYKRGVILYGNPGNGKSAVIREIIRRIGPDVNKIVINPNVSYEITTVLSSLIHSLKGAPTIIIMEDFDSFLSRGDNRSEFLNILDGINMRSGVYFIGTTNYPEKIDPAFINRSGRFDQTYRIDNPAKKTRELFFKSRDIAGLLRNYNNPNNEDINDIFVRYSKDLSMADLKEIITSTTYLLIDNPSLAIEEAVKKACNKLKFEKLDHLQKHMSHIASVSNKNNVVMPVTMKFYPYSRSITGHVRIIPKTNSTIQED